MLKSLFIQNFVLIDHLDIHFDEGFSVITGETGAGKSIILGALSLVLGQRADAKSLKRGADKCVIEAEFDISRYALEPFFASHDLEYDAGSCILRRELFASGKSRAFVNDSPVSLPILKALGGRLIDIHSQHQNLLLGDNRFQLRVIDMLAENGDMLVSYGEEYARYQAARKEQADLVERAAQSKQEEDYIRFQLEQLREADLRPGEQEALEREQETLSHAEEIKGALYKVSGLLEGEERGALSLLREALSSTRSLERYFPKAKEIVERLHSAYVDLGDLASEAETLKEDIEFNPNRLEWVNERLDTLYTLQQKHRVDTLDALIAVRESYEERLRAIESFDERIAEGEKRVAALYESVCRQALVLRERRVRAADVLVARLVALASPLGMPNIRFQVESVPRKEPESDGMDDICFLFSANKSAELRPVAQIASGGEIARLMLCIKALIAGFTALPTIIFDEVDTGVSGDIADKMGEIMRELGRKMQVLVITHLPQIAAKGTAHYFVYKQETDEHTLTRIRHLGGEERVNEIARMLSGASVTEASLANARELLGAR